MLDIFLLNSVYVLISFAMLFSFRNVYEDVTGTMGQGPVAKLENPWMGPILCVLAPFLGTQGRSSLSAGRCGEL